MLHRTLSRVAAVAALVAIVAATTSALAADGIWTQTVGLGPYNWSDVNNWDSGIVADGIDSTALFNNTTDTGGVQVINLDVPVTIGHISLESTGGNNRWDITGPNILTLDVTTGSPTINVPPTWNSSSSTGPYVSATIAGNDGLTVTGNRIMMITGTNTYTGTTTVDGAAVRFGPDSIGDTGRTVTGLNGGVVGATYAIDNTFLNRFIENDNEFFIATNGSTSNDLDFSSSTGAYLPNVTLGVVGKYNGTFTYSGTVTPADSTYRFGGGNAGTFNVASLLTGANAVVLTKSSQLNAPKLELTNAANDYTGGTTITGGATVQGGNFGTGSVTLDGVTWDNLRLAVTNQIIVTTNNATIINRGTLATPTVLNAPISGDGNVLFTTYSSNNAVRIMEINGACTHTGNTTVKSNNARAGYKINVDNALPATTVLTLEGSNVGSGRPVWFDLNGHSQTLAGMLHATRTDGAIVNGNIATDGALIVDNSSDVTYQAYLGPTNAHGNITQGTVSDSATGIPEGTGDNFSLTKLGAGKLTLTKNNSYTGDTAIEAGTLSIQQTYLADAADVYLNTDAYLDLAHTGTDTINSLFIDGSLMGAGLWGAIGSGANFESDWITGTGLLSVTTGPELIWDNNSATGDLQWETATNWDPEATPNVAYSCVIDNGDTVDLSEAGETANTIALGETTASGLNVSGTLEVFRYVEVGAGSTLDVSGGLSVASLVSAGTVTIDAAATSGDGTGVPSLGVADIYGGSVTAATAIDAESLQIEAATVAIAGGAVTNDASIAGGGTLNTGAALFEAASVSVTEGGSYIGTGALSAESVVVSGSSLSTVGGTVDTSVAVTVGVDEVTPGSAELGGVSVPVVTVDAVSSVTAAAAMTIGDKIEMGDTGKAISVTGGSFGAAGTFSVNDDDARTLTLSSEGSTVSIGTPGGGTPGLSYIPITNDADSDISSAKTYTHAIDFGSNAPVTVNDVTFVQNFGDSGGTATLNTGSTSIPKQHGGNTSANVTGAVEGLFHDMRYDDSTAEVILTGLTANQWYDVRLYNRQWGTSAGTRTQDFEYYIGSATTAAESVTLKEDDASSANPAWAFNQAYAMSYVYQADAAGSIKINVNALGSGTYHHYGLTNEEAVVGPASTADMINTDIVVTANSTLELLGDNAVTMGDLSLADGVTLSIADRAGAISFGTIGGDAAISSPVTNIVATGLAAGLSGNATDGTIDNDTLAVTATDLNLDGAKLALNFEPGVDATSRFGGTYTVATYSGTLTGALDTSELLGNIGEYYLKSVTPDAAIDPDGTPGTGDETLGIQVELWNLGTGDINLDGYVDVGDLSALSSGWDPGGVNQNSWLTGDLDFSGFVDIGDLSELSAGWAPGGVVLTSGDLDTTAIPEPGSAMMLLLAAAGLLAYRRRR